MNLYGKNPAKELDLRNKEEQKNTKIFLLMRSVITTCDKEHNINQLTKEHQQRKACICAEALHIPLHLLSSDQKACDQEELSLA